MKLGESLKNTAKTEMQEETGLAIMDLQLLGSFSRTDCYLKIKLYAVTAFFYTRNGLSNLVID